MCWARDVRYLEPTQRRGLRPPSTFQNLQTFPGHHWLGDKLTAFAPHTSGVPLYHPDGTVRDVQQVAKQLFDVGVLFDAATNFDTIVSNYDLVVEIERTYRDPNPSREDCLRDTWKACIGLLAQRPDIVAAYPDGAHKTADCSA
jgi:hypothetical protein